MDIQKGAQTTYQIGYHMVWGVKYHKHLLNNEIKVYLSKIIKEICDDYNYNFFCIGIAPNHVHLFVGAPPSVAPSRVAQIIKSIAARQLYKQYPGLRKVLYGGEIWKNGYYVGTVGEGQTESIIRNYLKQQGEDTQSSLEQLKYR
ncbi:IS200/IS605 family transposase [Candidatus Azambacteria bacterium]|nr:IS200/IS605 family transposase [Candidatus Azambacteria bacterium]